MLSMLASHHVRALRALILCVTAFGFAAEAAAADYPGAPPPLRGSRPIEPARPPYQPGSPIYYRWEGLYFGGQIGRSMVATDFANGTASLVNYILRNDIVLNHVNTWTVLGKEDSTSLSYGGFVGYNMQWDSVVLSFEGSYNRISISQASADSLSRQFGDDTVAPSQHHFFYTPIISGSATLRLTDFATLRARAGWAFDRFLPYGFLGVAVARGSVTRSATVSYSRVDYPDPALPPITPIDFAGFGPVTRSENLNNVFAYGYTAGVGIDIAVLPNVFVRAEWEWIQFSSFRDLNVHFNTVRTAIAVKF
jgi:opacity protein-like surface antigen